MEWVRVGVRFAFRGIDALYRVQHRLRPVGSVLFVGKTRYTGPDKAFADGTQLRTGHALGTLHFNNARIAALDAESPTALAFSFARLLRESLRTLSELGRDDGPFGDVTAFQGIGWWRQGEKAGFVSEPFPEGRRKRFLALHIGLLVWAYAPAGSTAIVARPEPRISWITRSTLIRRFSDAEETNRESANASADARAG
jgi:hypothetical protein